ncbi:unnamed protein product [Rotaria sordida]|uniref:Transmembrane protein n=1 Tax=Rotaria sordida TaxID=392033 RepID=A0A814P5B7_9BILA|nr:unnamed protein product [Rotaria sordida]
MRENIDKSDFYNLPLKDNDDHALCFPCILTLVFFVSIFLLCAISIEDVKPVSKVSRQNFVALPSYSKLLTLLKNRETKFYENDDDISREIKQLTSVNRRFFLFLVQRTTRRNRP